MTERIGTRELRADLAAHVRRASAGQRVVITSAGRAVATLGPVDTSVGAAPTLDALVAAGVPASRINSVEEALVDPQTEARGAVVEHDHPTLGRVRSIRTPLRLSDRETSLERSAERGPLRGEHTEAVLVELCGYAAERMRALEEAGVFGERVAAT